MHVELTLNMLALINILKIIILGIPNSLFDRSRT